MKTEHRLSIVKAETDEGAARFAIDMGEVVYVVPSGAVGFRNGVAIHIGPDGVKALLDRLEDSARELHTEEGKRSGGESACGMVGA